MADYLVRARASGDLRVLKEELDSGAIAKMKPFGKALDFSLRNARTDPDDRIVWEEEDYCTPPLAMERAAVLGRYFTDLRVERVPRGEGWERIGHLPRLWDAAPQD